MTLNSLIGIRIFIMRSALLRLISVLSGIFCCFTAYAGQSAPQSIAFYYQKVDSVRELLSYDRVVVNAEGINPAQLKQLQRAQVKVFAYLSVGEALPPLSHALRQAVITENTAWQSLVMDLQQPLWQQHLQQKAQQLTAAGFDGIFLDTLDSYLLAPPALHDSQREALVSILNTMAQHHPRLILNRGFEFLPALTFKPTAIVAESLYAGYNAQQQQYVQQSDSDTAWLLQRLQQVQQRDIEVIVIDYLPEDLTQRIAHARQILAQGFTPYIADGLLEQHGVSLHYPLPRRVLGLFDNSQGPKKQSRCHRYLATLIEYAGYVPDCVDISTLQGDTLSLQPYAAALLMLPEVYFQQPQVSRLLPRLLNTMPTVFIGNLPTNAQQLQQLGLTQQGYYQGKLQSSLPTLYPLPQSAGEEYPRYVITDTSTQALAHYHDSNGNIGVAIVKAPWGGAILAPGDLQELTNDRQRWMHDPFATILPLLRLPQLPAPDITTESGQRIVTAHIDGDGFPSVAWLPGKPFAAEAIYQRILQRYPLPHTVSVVEAEVAKHGLYPQLSDQLEAIARDIFRLPNVEVASHTFSHPFFWDPRVSSREKLYGDALPVPGYQLDYAREVAGSVAYINQQLAPADKPVRVFLWSGMANPTPDIIAKTSALGLVNVNGGNTYVLNDNFSYAQVSPHLNWYPDAVQVYTPIMNENLYTELWTENFSGYARVTETLTKLGEPRRLKPVSIYYHMYSGMYPSSLGALDYIYQWALQQPFTPLYLSEFAQRASALYETGVAASLTHEGYVLRSTGIRSVRLPADTVLSADSSGIAGIVDGPDGRYATLVGPLAKVVATEQRRQFDGKPYLLQANGMVQHWQLDGQMLSLTLHSHIPLIAVLEQAEHCQVEQASNALTISRQQQKIQFSSTVAGHFSLTLRCTATEVVTF